ncbi:glycoside hydrolase family 55 protein [Laetiporus sulphureus 93-53]|uniref:Glycoside hydrolase family 55 protein n=1 Tax=Laetiporus sulphureus 93-53 TaxID=1314785 RepID=A0A165H6B4_9APHY|nr:glycoside hydrolase family 55 protein [Laetiporus sulphureus 93-53]KZT11301.1 glycoside hydrolase family 55 protein [Laetiporus sulphureus 93-53]
MLAVVVLLAYGLVFSAPLTFALGTKCSAAVASGTAAAGDPFWLENITHQGISAFNADPSSYTVFRNVKDYGATGDGTTDDTDAINSAISDGGRCGDATCASSTVTPAVVFFPQGTYLVSSPIIAYYYTQLIGDARVPPTLLASSSFSGIAVIDVDPYIAGGYGAQWYNDTNNFYRDVRNFVIDLTDTDATDDTTGIHWQVAQGTSLYNIEFQMSTASDTAHQGIYMENGSGGFIGDLVFNGGKYAMWVGNQQFTARNITMTNCNTGVYLDWDWGWTFQGITISDCEIGFDVSTGGTNEADQTAGAISIIDATASSTPVFLQTTESSSSLAGSIVLNNVALTDCDTAVGTASGDVILAGGTTTISSWGQGNVWSGTSSSYTFTQGDIAAPTKASSLLSNGMIFGRTMPQYADYAVDQFVSVKTLGATGDGSTDDTSTLQSIFDEYSGCYIIYFDAGTYIITSTLTIPAGTQMVGEAWSVIMGSGSAFEDQSNPTVMVQVGDTGSTGTLEITNMMFSTQGSTPGAIVVEWNVAADTQGYAGMWDTYFRLGGAAGTDLQTAECPYGSDSDSCFAAFLALHLTAESNAYLEGTWVWLADHDLDISAQTQLTIFSGRGILSESAGPVWMIGTAAEHHTLYQYSLNGASDHYMGMIQTETPYYQPSPAVPSPFSVESTYNDPSFPSSQTSAWALYVQDSTDIIVFGAGHYSFFENYAQTCLDSMDCQSQIANVDSSSTLYLYSLSTVGSSYMWSVSEAGVVPESDNVDGYQSTVTVWTQ